MTAIVGMEENGMVWIGGDSAAASGWRVRKSALPKVFKVGPFLIGYTSSFRMGQLLEHHLEVAPQDDTHQSDLAYLVREFIPVVRDLLKSGGYTTIENNSESGGFFLLGYNGRLYEVNSDFQVNHYTDGFAALGCGEDFALGALSALLDTSPDMPARDKVTIALDAATRLSGGVTPPYIIEAI